MSVTQTQNGDLGCCRGGQNGRRRRIVEERRTEYLLLLLVAEAAWEWVSANAKMNCDKRTGIAESVATIGPAPPLGSVGDTTPLALEVSLIDRLASALLFKNKRCEATQVRNIPCRWVA